MATFRDRLSRIDTRNPVNRTHPYNVGRVAWWLAPKATAGGRNLYDLMGLYPGTLTGMGAGFGWKASIHYPALAELKFDGVNSFVDCGNSPALNPTAAATYLVRFRLAPAAIGSQVWLIARDDNALGRAFALGINAGGNINLQVSGGNVMNLAPPTAFAANVDYHLVLSGSQASGNMTPYLNGVGLSPSGYSTPPTATGSTTLGERTYSGFEARMPGWILEASLHNVEIPARFAYGLYAESVAGYPTTLNRVRTFNTAAASSALLFRRSPATRAGSRGMLV